MTELLQKLFDASVNGVAAQGELGARRGPRYREECPPEGRRPAMCAIGVLIPDERYEVRFEGISVLCGNVLSSLPLLDGRGDDDIKHAALFLSDMQKTHDFCLCYSHRGAFFEDYSRACRDLAKKWGLDAPAVQKLYRMVNK